MKKKKNWYTICFKGSRRRGLSANHQLSKFLNKHGLEFEDFKLLPVCGDDMQILYHSEYELEP